MSTTLPCPASGDHGTECICNGARELIVRPKTALCETCGDPAAQRNLGFIANVEGRIVGTPCTECGAVGDVAEFARRKAAADAAAGPEAPVERSEFARAVGSDKPKHDWKPAAAGEPVKPVDPRLLDSVVAPRFELPAWAQHDDEWYLEKIRGAGLFNAEQAYGALASLPQQRADAAREMVEASDRDQRVRVMVWMDDLDRSERIAKRILAELA